MKNLEDVILEYLEKDDDIKNHYHTTIDDSDLDEWLYEHNDRSNEKIMKQRLHYLRSFINRGSARPDDL